MGGHDDSRWTRSSFFYLIGYLTLGGVGLLLAPGLALQLLGSTGSYSPVLVRLLGAFLIAIDILIVQIVRHRVEVLYPTTLIVRAVLLGTIVALYLASRDLLFVVLAGLVGFGMLLTGTALLADRRAHTSPSSPSQRRIV